MAKKRLRLPLILRMCKTAFKAWRADNAPRMGAALAYYTLFATAPILLIAIAVAGIFFGPEAVRGEIVEQINRLTGPEGAAAIESLLANANEQKSGIIATIIGSVTVVIASTGAFLELQAALNTIWRVKPKEGGAVLTFLMLRLRSFGLVVATGFLLLVSLVVSAGLAALANWAGERLPGLAFLWGVLNFVVTAGVITTLFALIYRVLPDVELRWRDVWTGALVTAVLFTVGQLLIGLYLGRSATASSYGAAGSVVVLLVWVYYSSQIVLLGAEFTKVYTQHERSKPQPSAHAERCPRPSRRADTAQR